jgi:hypothetical protein
MSDTPDSYATQADILQVGERFPGEDVAVLKTKTPLQLISLPLGSSAPLDLPQGADVTAFGFPGATYEFGGLKEDQKHPRVIPHSGQMVQRIATEKNWEALYVTMNVSPGDSGGPVVDAYGRVVGLNDAGNPHWSGNNVAVPIDVAKKYLDKAGVQAAAGRLTEHWTKGQLYYWQKDYARARREFEFVNGTGPDPDRESWWSVLTAKLPGRRGNSRPDWAPAELFTPVGRGNEYVKQAIENCNLKLGKR